MSEALGVGRNPADRWRKSDDGIHVLAAAFYGYFREDHWLERGGKPRDVALAGHLRRAPRPRAAARDGRTGPRAPGDRGSGRCLPTRGGETAVEEPKGAGSDGVQGGAGGRWQLLTRPCPPHRLPSHPILSTVAPRRPRSSAATTCTGEDGRCDGRLGRDRPGDDTGARFRQERRVIVPARDWRRRKRPSARWRRSSRWS